MLKPVFLLQALPVVALILAGFLFVLFKMLSRLKPREDAGSTSLWLDESAHPDKNAPELKRIAGTHPVSIHAEQGSFEAEAKEISLGGAFIICPDPLPIGTPLELTLDLKEPLELKAAVTWNNSNVPEEERVVCGMRVRFLDMSAGARAKIFDPPPANQSHPDEQPPVKK